MDTFKVIIPADILKSKDGEWRVVGLASTGSVDRQGEVIVPEGIDATPIAKGCGFFNYDHDNSPESTIGTLDSYKKTQHGMYVEGRLFKNHTKAKAVYEIMSSLSKGDKGRVGMSIEGKVIERDKDNPRIIKKCLVKNVAITLNPVNTDTYADLAKSMAAGDIEFASTGNVQNTEIKPEELTFTATQVVSIVEKALSVGSGYTQAPGQLQGGAALSQESLDKKKVKKIKKGPKDLYKSQMLTLLEKLQVLYPENSRSEIWAAVQERLETTFPQLK